MVDLKADIIEVAKKHQINITKISVKTQTKYVAIDYYEADRKKRELFIEDLLQMNREKHKYKIGLLELLGVGAMTEEDAAKGIAKYLCNEQLSIF